MGLSQQQIEALDAEDAHLAAAQTEPAPAAVASPDGTVSDLALSFRPAPAAATPAPAPPADARLTPEQLAALDAEDAHLAAAQQPGPGAAPQVQLDGSAPDENEPVARPGMFGALEEWVKPTQGFNKKLDQLPDWLDMPELHQLSKNSALAVFGTLISGPEETKKILQTQFPKMDIRQDGRYLVMKSADGQEYAWKPGLQASDIKRMAAAGAGTALGTALATMAVPALAGSTGAGALASAAAGAGAAAAGSAGLRAVKRLAGGDFGAGGFALDTAIGGAAPLVGKLVGKAAGAAKDAAARALGLAPAGEDLAQTMERAARGGTQAASDVAEQVRPDAGFVDAANRQGLLDQVHPDQASTNPRYRELAQTAEGSAERHAATTDAVRKRFEDVVEAAGGDVDRSLLSGNVTKAVEKEIADKYAQARQLYTEAAVPKNAPAPMNGLLAEIDSIAAARNGRLPPALQKLRAAASPVDGAPRTWDEADALVKELGNPQGAYKKLEPGLAKKLRPIADLDRQAVAEAHGVGDKFRAAQEAFKDALAFEDKAVAAYGEKATNALQRIDQGVKGLAGGNVEPFEQVIAGTPASMRSKVADSSVLSLFAEDSRINPVKWFDKLQKNERAYNALMGNLSPTVREGLQDSITILRGVQQAAGAKGASFAQSSGLARKLLGLAVVGTVSAASHAAGFSAELPILGAMFVKEMLAAPRTPLREAVKDLITSPAGRIALEAAANGTAIPQGKLAAMAASAPVRGLMKAIGVPASDSFRWLSRAIATSATNAATQPGLTQEAQ